MPRSSRDVTEHPHPTDVQARAHAHPGVVFHANGQEEAIPEKTCIVQNCNRPTRSSRTPLCNPHYIQQYRGLPFKEPRKKRYRINGAICKFGGCGEVQSSRGHCAYHYAQMREGRDLTPHPGPQHPVAGRDERGRKRCPACGEWKPTNAFRPNVRNGDGLESRCSPCRARQQADYKREWKYGVSPDEFEGMLAAQHGACLVCGGRSPKYWVVDHDHACCPGDMTCGACVRGILCSPCNLALGSIHDNPETTHHSSHKPHTRKPRTNGAEPMMTPDYMKLWHATLAREEKLERELEQLRRNAAPVPDVDPQPILKALAVAHGQISDARAYIREMEDTISHLRKMARVRTALQRDVAESTRRRQLDAKADALYDAATNLERNPPSTDIWGKSLPGHIGAIRRLREIASELTGKPEEGA